MIISNPPCLVNTFLSLFFGLTCTCSFLSQSKIRPEQSYLRSQYLPLYSEQWRLFSEFHSSQFFGHVFWPCRNFLWKKLRSAIDKQISCDYNTDKSAKPLSKMSTSDATVWRERQMVRLPQPYPNEWTYEGGRKSIFDLRLMSSNRRGPHPLSARLIWWSEIQRADA